MSVFSDDVAQEFAGRGGPQHGKTTGVQGPPNGSSELLDELGLRV